VTAHSGAAETTDQGWNGVANPALFHAFVNPGTEFGQVYVPDEKRYVPVTLSDAKFVVGEGAFVQAPADKPITVTPNGTFAAPRRTRAQANLTYDVRIAPAEASCTDRLFIKTTDDKEEDVYTVGQDLAKLGVSNLVPQMWINRYNEKLCVNTQALQHATITYPLGIQVPAEGEYTISIQNADDNDQTVVYLTLDGRVIWNLSMAPYTTTMEAGTSQRYGLRLNAKAPQTATDIDEAIIDARGDTRKVLIDNQVFIIRGNNVYSVDGQLVK
jgi:predicted  nucleic acid-binding Zn-ribbon protein